MLYVRSVCNFALLAGEYGVFDLLWGFLMDPDTFSGIFKSLAMLGMYVCMSNMFIWLLSLTGWFMHSSPPLT